ncbi:hypothetical protein [Campylobacter suis]|uniref:Uncharacterized protein n=2 Tax=Campylobacter TaxID=194 RepID=A0ABN7K3W2_9BACT|nr:hypothetical protein [Campylobacter suis]CAD7287192.1 hypothetical protein LMG8286_00823 [Campylobacter suis]
MSEKQELLKFHDIEQMREENLGWRTLFVAFACLAIAFCIFLPKIYFANKIYYISMEITEISNKRDVLLEENRVLKNKLEALKYKINIKNPLQAE